MRRVSVKLSDLNFVYYPQFPQKSHNNRFVVVVVVVVVLTPMWFKLKLYNSVVTLGLLHVHSKIMPDVWRWYLTKISFISVFLYFSQNCTGVCLPDLQKKWLSAYQIFEQVPNQQYTIFDRQVPNFLPKSCAFYNKKCSIYTQLM